MKWLILITLTISVFSLGVYTGTSRTVSTEIPMTNQSYSECTPESIAGDSNSVKAAEPSQSDAAIPSPDELWAAQNGQSVEDLQANNETEIPSTYTEEPLALSFGSDGSQG